MGSRFGTERKAWRHEDPAELAWPGGEATELASVALKPCTVTVVPGGERPKEKRVSTLQVALVEGGGRRGGLRK